MKLKLALLAGALTAACAGTAFAGPVSQNTTAQANIVSANQVTAQRDLQFGTIAKTTSTASTVSVASAAAASATPTITGGNAFIPTAGQAHAAQFRITGTSGQTYSVTTPTLTFVNSAGNLANISALAPVSDAGSLNTIPNTGVDDLYVGGQFDISTSTAVQAYSGTLSITVNFN